LNVDVNMHPIFILKDIKYSALQSLMNYMYRCEVYVAQEYLESFLQAAQTLKIRGLPTWETMWMFSESEWGAGLGDPAGKGNIRTLPSGRQHECSYRTNACLFSLCPDKHCSKSNYSTDTTSTDDDDEGTSTLDVSSPVVDAAPPSSGAIVNVEDEEDDSMSQSSNSNSPFLLDLQNPRSFVITNTDFLQGYPSPGKWMKVIITRDRLMTMAQFRLAREETVQVLLEVVLKGVKVSSDTVKPLSLDAWRP